MKLNILSKKEIKRIKEAIFRQWGSDMELDYVFLQGGKGKIYIANKKVFDLDLSKMRIDSIGLYFGRIEQTLRLSIEGSQIVGPHAKKFIADVPREWTKGEDADIELPNGIYLAKHNGAFLGCAKSTGTKLINYYPKSRRI